MADLIINKKDALKEWGIKMGDGFLNSLGVFAPVKEYITNNSRLEDGIRYCEISPKLNERDVNLIFRITGTSHSDFLKKKTSFMNELYRGDVEIEVPPNSNDVYFLKYVNCTSYGQNISRTAAKIVVKFKEPNPTRRARK